MSRSDAEPASPPRKRGRPKGSKKKTPVLEKLKRGRPTLHQELARTKAKLAIALAQLAEAKAKHAVELANAVGAAELAKQQAEKMLAAGGPKESDPLAAMDRGLRILGESLEMAMRDTSMTGREQRAEARAILRSMNQLVPASRNLAAERLVKDAMRSIDSPGPTPVTKPVGPTDSEPLQIAPRSG